MAGKRVIPPSKQNIKGISDKISVPENPDPLSVSFSKFKLDPICEESLIIILKIINSISAL